MNLNEQQVEELLAQIRNISHGPTSGPLGLEAVTMAIAGRGVPGDDNLASAIRDVADAIRELALAVREA